jgi:hypothetical protein
MPPPPGFTFVSPWTFPERLLFFGVQGTGKSKAVLDIARQCPAATFRVVDTDYSQSFRRALELEYTDLRNVIYEWVDQEEFEEMADCIATYADETQEGDWCVVDSMTPSWNGVQGYFIEQVHGDDDAGYFLHVRKEIERLNREQKSLGALEGWMDWPVINKMYRRKIIRPLRVCQGHVILTAELSKVSDEDDKEVRNLFGPYGVKPAGQKSLGHFPSSVFMLTKPRAERYEITTIKDRQRPEFEGDELTNFFNDYLKPIAKFKPVKYAA